MRRLSFLIQVRPGESSTIENLRTHERLPITDYEAVAPVIERWVSEADTEHPDTDPRPQAGGESGSR